MSGDWQVGDLALCIDDDIRNLSEKVLKQGRVYTVEGLDVDPAFAEIGLFLSGVPRVWSDHWRREVGYLELRFRKITPDEADEFDRETIALSQTQPVGEPA